MPRPKSVTKINKNGVTYISDVDRAVYTLEELTRAALKDVGRFLLYTGKRSAPKKRGDYKKNMATWVRKNRITGIIELQFGIYDPRIARKKNKPPIYYAHIIEFGSRFVRGLKILTNTVMNNLSKIREIESKYLSYIEDDLKAQSLIKEEDEVNDK